tara:strand:- start:97 stop:591 length:495 start_codon:yes stop_codon:yes gene_type:complete
MRDIRSIGYNFVPIIFWVLIIYFTTGEFKNLDYILDNIEYVILSLIFVIIISVNIIRVNRHEIIKELYFIPITLKRRMWKEIKFFAEVDEVSYGQHGKRTTSAIWFIDYNERVCLRFTKKFRNNLDEILNTLDKYEEKHDNKITITNPILMSKGWTKFKVPKNQ